MVRISKYLAEFRAGLHDKMTLLKTDSGDLRSDPGVPKAVITSWEISLEGIPQQSANLLFLMYLFNRQAIPQ